MLAELKDNSSPSGDDEDNELAPLEPVVERACSTYTCFVYSTFGSGIGGVSPGMQHSEK